MQYHTVSHVLPVSRDRAYDFLSREENLPRWAVEFATEVKKSEEGWLVNTRPFGEICLRYECNAQTGVIDLYSGPERATMEPAWTRVTALGPDTSLYTFTIGAPTQEILEQQCAGLHREFEELARLLKEESVVAA